MENKFDEKKRLPCKSVMGSRHEIPKAHKLSNTKGGHVPKYLYDSKQQTDMTTNAFLVFSSSFPQTSTCVI